MLGTAVRNAFNKDHHHDSRVLSLSHSQSGQELVSIDLTKTGEVDALFTQFKPNCGSSSSIAFARSVMRVLGVIHCAAERRPDVAEKVRAGQIKRYFESYAANFISMLDRIPMALAR